MPSAFVDLLDLEPQQEARRERTCKGPAHRGELEPALREGARRGKAQAHEHFPAEDKSAQKPGAGRASLLAHSKSHGRHHRSGVRDRGGMGGIIFERVHERAVAKRCCRRRRWGCEAERRRIAPRFRTRVRAQPVGDCGVEWPRRGQHPVDREIGFWLALRRRPGCHRSGWQASALRRCAQGRVD